MDRKPARAAGPAAAGNFPAAAEISPADGSHLESEPGANIRYTLDGTVPTDVGPAYEKPFR